MNSIELRVNARRYTFSGPSGWAELTTRQAVAITRLRQRVGRQPETLFTTLQLLYGIKPRQQRWLFDDDFLRRKGLPETNRLLILAQGQELLDSLRWIGETNPAPVFPPSFRRYDYRFGTGAVLIRKLFCRTCYRGPAEGLGTATFETFIAADKAYRDGNLPRLAAVLYASRQGESQQHREALFASLEPALLHLIADRFASTLLHLQRCFKFVFPEKLSSKTENVGKPHLSFFDNGQTGTWLDVAIGMAKMDVTKIPEIEQTNLYLALKVLNEQLRQATQMETEIAKMKRAT